MICENISTCFLPLTWQRGILIIVLGAFSPCYRDFMDRQAEVNFINKIYGRVYLLDYCN